MPTLSIGGRDVSVGDSFLSLSPDEQNSTVDEIASSLPVANTADAAPVGLAPIPPQPQGPTHKQSYLATDPMGNPIGMQESDVPDVPPAEMPYGQQMSNIGSGADNLVRQVANGASFGLADKFAAGMRTATGDAPNYDSALNQERQRTNDFSAEHPGVAAGANIAGGLATGGALVKSGATLFNAAKNVPLIVRPFLYGAEGAAYGAAHGAGHVDTGQLSDYLDAAKSGAETGLAWGAGLPFVGAGLGAAYRNVASRLSSGLPGVSRAGSHALESATTADSLGANSLLGMAASADRSGLEGLSQLGDHALLADAGPSFTGLAQGIIPKPSAGRTALVTALENRHAATPTRLAADLAANLGPAESPIALTNTLHDARTAITRPMYENAFSNAAPVNTASVLSTINNLLPTAVGGERAALLKAGNLLMPEGNNGARALVSDAQTLHNVKGELDHTIEYGDPGLGVPPSAKSREQGALKTVRHSLNTALQDQVPGYATANAKSAEYANYAKNVESGTSLLDGGKSAVWPSDYAPQFDALTPPGQAAIRSGVRASIENKLGTQPNDLSALKKSVGGELDWNRANMATTFGAQPTANVVGAINREQRFAQTYADVARNSQTPQRLAGSALVDAQEMPEIPMDASGVGVLAKVGHGILRGGYNAVIGQRADSVRNELGHILSMPKTQERDALVEALLSRSNNRTATAAAIKRKFSGPELANALMSSGQ